MPIVESDNGGIPEAIADGGVIVPDSTDLENRFIRAIVDAIEHK